jgi:hypothetical protein
LNNDIVQKLASPAAGCFLDQARTSGVGLVEQLECLERRLQGRN